MRHHDLSHFMRMGCPPFAGGIGPNIGREAF
jgi:hypothetical protein